MDDKKYYRNTLKVLDATSTFGTVLNRLGEISVETEDEKLKKMAAAIANLVRAMHQKPTTKIRLLSIPAVTGSQGLINQLVAVTHTYCTQCIASSAKQWEILATRAGWTPPSKQ